LPPATKRIGGPLLRLPTPQTIGEFPSVLLERRTWRAFGRGAVPFAQLSTLLNLTTGVQAWADSSLGGKLAFKTSPSGGARHPIEAYLAALNCDDIARGVYHYAADRHGLTRIGNIDRSEVRSLLPQQDWYRAAGAIVFFTAIVGRTMWRYPY